MDHVVQEDALEKLSVSADSIHNLLGQGGEGSVGRGEDCEGSLTSQGVCEAGLDGEVDQRLGCINHHGKIGLYNFQYFVACEYFHCTILEATSTMYTTTTTSSMVINIQLLLYVTMERLL